MKPSLIPAFELILASAIWGFAFVAQRKGNESLHPLLFNGLRFALGALALVVASAWVPKEEKRASKPIGLEVLLLGFVLFIAASLQQIGLLWTGAGSAGFITGLYVVFVPLIGLWRGQKPAKGILIAIVLAVPGLWLINRGAALEASFGNLLVLISALFWAVHVQMIDKLTRQHASLGLAVSQYIVCAGLSLASWGVGQLSGLIAVHRLEIIQTGISQALLPLLYGGLASVGIAYTLQLHAQKKVAPAPASIILCLEGAFALLGGWLMLHEKLSPEALIGAALLLAAMLISISSSARGSSEILIDKKSPSRVFDKT